MNNRLLKTALGIALGLCGAAVPGYSSAFLAFSTTSSGGTIQVTGDSTSDTLSELSSIAYDTLDISNAPNAAANGYWQLTTTTLSQPGSGGTVTVSITIGCAESGLNGSCTSDNAFNGVGTLTWTFPQSAFVLYTGGSSLPTGDFDVNNVGTPTSVSLLFTTGQALSGVSSAFIADLGLTDTTDTINGGGAQGSETSRSGSGSGQVTTFSASSQTLGATIEGSVATTPEPVSFVLFGSGLLGIAWAARRRSDQS